MYAILYSLVLSSVSLCSIAPLISFWRLFSIDTLIWASLVCLNLILLRLLFYWSESLMKCLKVNFEDKIEVKIEELFIQSLFYVSLRILYYN